MNSRNSLFCFLIIFTSSVINLINPTNLWSLDKNQSFIEGIDKDYIKNIPKNDYILGSGDQIIISISEYLPELSNTSVVDGEGTINLPLINRIYVRGLSIKELNKILNEEYKKFVKEPNVQTSVVRYRPVRVLLKGEIVDPGLYILDGSLSSSSSKFLNPELMTGTIIDNSRKSTNSSYSMGQVFFPTVFDAIRKGGGLTRFSDISRIKVIRKNNLSNGGGKISTVLNFENISRMDDLTQNIRIYDNDVIEISKTQFPNKMNLLGPIANNLNPKFVRVFVSGRIYQPGVKNISSASTLTDAIDISGGTKVFKGPVRFIRLNNDGTLDKRVFRLKRNAKRGSFKNPILRDGDLIFVGESFISQTNQVISEFTSPFTGLFSTYGLIKAIQGEF